MNRIRRAFLSLREHPCWGVTKGHGSFLRLEFGLPNLIIREPKKATIATSKRIRDSLARRHVWVGGQWHLWIYCCDWAVFDANFRLIGDCSSSRRISAAARYLNGQKLINVQILGRGARTDFSFDLGARLLTKPYDRTSEQWMLYEPTGYVLSFRADRKYSYQKGSTKPEKEIWRKLAV